MCLVGDLVPLRGWRGAAGRPMKMDVGGLGPLLSPAFTFLHPPSPAFTHPTLTLPAPLRPPILLLRRLPIAAFLASPALPFPSLPHPPHPSPPSRSLPAGLLGTAALMTGQESTAATATLTAGCHQQQARGARYQNVITGHFSFRVCLGVHFQLGTFLQFELS